MVAPGFVDGHTHMDAQVFWDPLGTSSCWHGITSVVMGNCGFTLAPCAAADKHMVIRNLQRAEDISPQAMEAGIKWHVDDLPRVPRLLESLPKGINYAGYIGHSALRTYVMGERAFEQQASEDDMARWSASCATRSAPAPSASPRRGRPRTRPPMRVPSRAAPQRGTKCGDWSASWASWAPASLSWPARASTALPATRACASITFGCATSPWRPGGPSRSACSAGAACRMCGAQYLALLDETAAAGGRMFAQVHSRSLTALLSFKTQLPFDRLPVWKDLRSLPLRRAAAEAPRSRAAPSPRRGIGCARQPAAGRHRGAACRTTTGFSSSTPWGAASHGGRGRARARPASGRDA